MDVTHQHTYAAPGTYTIAVTLTTGFPCDNLSTVDRAMQTVTITVTD